MNLLHRKQSTSGPQKSKSLNKDQKTLLIASVALIAIAVLVIVFWQPIINIFSSQEQVKQLIDEAGAWGPFVFMALQALQVIFAPIPGQAVSFVGGFAFGGWLGAIYSMIGTALGFTAVFLLARRLGRPFVKRFVSDKYLKKFDYLAADKGVMIFFLIFLLPAFPDDIVCYVAGLSKIPLRTLITISLIGRAPSVLIVSLSGAGIANDNFVFTAGSLVVATLIFVVAVWKRQPLERFVESFSTRKKLRKGTDDVTKD